LCYNNKQLDGLGKLKGFASVLSEHVRLNDYIPETVVGAEAILSLFITQHCSTVSTHAAI